MTPEPASPAHQPPHPWRSLDELAASPDFETWLHREFPRQAAARDHRLSRRQFLKLVGASLALAGAASCGVPPREQIVPYVRKPDNLIPGEPLFFATTMPLGGYGLGLLVESHEGRPTKVEGNPAHPATLGATDSFAQASVLELYDPDRAKSPRREGAVRPWSGFWREMGLRLDEHRARAGAGLRLLTGPVSSPTLAAQIKNLLGLFPQAVWHQYQPVNRDNARAGARLAFGKDVEAVYQLEQADVVVALDADFLTSGPGAVRYAHDFALRRRPETASMNRLYVVESTHTSTGAMADHRLPLQARQVEGLARALAAALGVASAPPAEPPAGVPRGWFDALVRDLDAHRGASLVIAGQGQPPSMHALAYALNQALGNVGKTLRFIAPVAAQPVDETESLRALIEAMALGQVQTLLIFGGNPAYAAPADFNFGRRLEQVELSVYLSLFPDETAALAHWHLPESHFLEAWGDVRAFDGTASIIQPLLAPLYETRAAIEVAAGLAGDTTTGAYDLVRAAWQRAAAGADFETYWRAALNAGVIPKTASATVNVALQANWLPAPSPPADNGLELVFRPDPSIYDGCFFNNAWLQELPRPITSLTWDNAALMSPATAERLGVKTEDVVGLAYRQRTLRAAVLVVPGHAADSVTLHLGYGHPATDPQAAGGGFNAYSLRFADAPWFDSGLALSRTDDTYPLAVTQHHHLIEGRDLLRTGTLQQYQDNPNFAHESEHYPGAGQGQTPPSLYPEHPYPDESWGMVIDLGACTGCNACVAACQAENNIPVVGKEQVRAGREMHWLRVDSYFAGEAEAPSVNFQPVPCMHCETAPCEVVCPVAATTHSSDGLNEMIYNRCVGTRYCSNNCPYKVRRFNFLDFTAFEREGHRDMQANPDVTVRTRGVMEKCTYCVQRIRAGQRTAENAGRPVADGEVVTACQGACPTQAITFGNLKDPNSRVAQQRANPRDYEMLGELGTRPHTTYWAALRNPNPEIG